MRKRLPTEPGGGDLRELLPRLGHELRTPVQVIAGFVELRLAEQAGPLTPEQRRYLEEVRRSSARLARFASELSAGAAAVSHPVTRECASLEHLVEGVGAALKPLLDPRRHRLPARSRSAPAARCCGAPPPGSGAGPQ